MCVGASGRTLAISRKGLALTKRMGAFSDSAAHLLMVFQPREAQAFVALLSRFIEQHEKTLSA